MAALLLSFPLLAQVPELPQQHPVPATYERLLLPVFTPPVFGAFGSEFHTTLLVSNKSENQTAHVYGLTESCGLLDPCFPSDPHRQPLLVTTVPSDLLLEYKGTPGRFLYVPKTEVDMLTMNLRVHDVTRADLNFGTEMPIVRERDFGARIVLTGLPSDSRFRNTLRIYSLGAQNVGITINDGAPFTVALQPGETIFDPGYAIFNNFPQTDAETMMVAIDAENPPVLPILPIGIWAFATVTNNETQTISTITPQP